MSSNSLPQVALCPRCLCPLDISRGYAVDFCLPLQPTFPPTVHTSQVPDQHPVTGTGTLSLPPPAPQESDTPAPPYERSSYLQLPRCDQDDTNPGESRRSSASSSTSFDSAFSEFSINTEFAAELQAAEDRYISQQPPQASSPPPPPASSPSTESSVTLPTLSTPSLSTESSLTPTELDELPSTARRWVVFRGRVPGVYTSSTEATGQTDGFPHAFMLGFDDLTAANTAYERFQEDGRIPMHGRGPWVVFVGRQRGVFTSYEELNASVLGFPNSCYRCCESVEEGTKALHAFLMNRAAEIFPTSTAQTVSGPACLEHDLRLATSIDDSWWCCFAGAEPGVYHGLDSLIRAAPAPGGVRRVNSEVEGWEMWTKYLANGGVSITPRA